MSKNKDKTERTYPLRMPKDWEPSVPAWSSVFDSSQSAIAMAVIGFQHPADAQVNASLQTLAEILKSADICDLVKADAGNGLYESACITYWCDTDVAAKVLDSDAFNAFWQQHINVGKHGLFKEYVNIPLQRTETIFSGPEHLHGYSQARTGITGPILHHMYWGSMRDRLPLSANDKLQADSPLRIVESDGKRTVIQTHENLCIIRSGQDWSQCDKDQLREYIDVIEPTLETGMNFLRDQGAEVNCYSCRYWRDVNPDGTEPKRSSGMAYFKSIEDLENWAEHHPSHLKIFGTFNKIATKYGPDLQLRLWHEVSVLPGTDCQAEYINCQPGTGWIPSKASSKS